MNRAKKLMVSAIQTFKAWIEQLDFRDRDKNQSAFYLHVATLIILPVAFAIAVLYGFAGRWDYVILAAAIMFAFSFILALVRRKHLQLAANLFLLLALFLHTTGLLYAGGIHSTSALLYPVILIFASLLLDTKSFVLYSLLCIISVGVIIFAENQRFIQPYVPDPTDFSLFFTLSLMVLSTALVIRVVTQNLQANLRKTRQAEQALQQGENQIRMITDHIPGYVAYVDAECRYVFANQRYADSFNLRRDQIIGRKVVEVVGEPFYRTVEENIKAALAGQGITFEAPIQLPNQGERWITVSYLPDLDETHKVKGLFVFVHDITERKRAEDATKHAEQTVRNLNTELEQRVKERTAALEAAHRELESLSYTIGHDLRSPIRAITAYSQMLLDKPADQPDGWQEQKLKQIHRESAHMGAMVDDFLTFLRLGRTFPEKKAIDLHQVVEDILNEIKPETSGRDVQFIIQPMPPCWVDVDLMRDVLSHLLSNAVKFTSKRQDARIEIGAAERHGENCYFVRDNGVGFEMKYAGKLFGAFQRLHHVDEFNGTGMGLAIVQRIIQRHGGRIWVEASPGEGATFYFTVGEGG